MHSANEFIVLDDVEKSIMHSSFTSPWSDYHCLRDDMECDPRYEEKRDIQDFIESNTAIVHGVKLLAGYTEP